MNNSLSIVLAAALGLPALAGTAGHSLWQDGNPTDTAPTAQQPMAGDLDGALAKLETALKAKQLDAEVFAAVRTSLEQRPGIPPHDPTTRVVTARLQRVVEGLRERSDADTLAARHIDMLREQIVDERVEFAIDRLAEAAQSAQASEADFEAVTAQLAHRAQVSRSFDERTDEMKAELTRELSLLQQRSKAGGIDRADVERFRRRAATARIDNTLGTLHAQAMASDLTVSDLVRLRGLLDNHAARAADDAEFTALRTKLIENLDSIEGKLRSGALDPEDLTRMRENLRSAREASADKAPQKPTQKPTDKPSEKREQKPTDKR